MLAIQQPDNTDSLRNCHRQLTVERLWTTPLSLVLENTAIYKPYIQLRVYKILRGLCYSGDENSNMFVTPRDVISVCRIYRDYMYVAPDRTGCHKWLSGWLQGNFCNLHRIGIKIDTISRGVSYGLGLLITFDLKKWQGSRFTYKMLCSLYHRIFTGC